MTIESGYSFTNVSKKEKTTLSKKEELAKRARAQFSGLIDCTNDPQKWADAILERIEPFFQHMDKRILSDEKIAGIKDSLKECRMFTDKKSFLDEAMKVLEPILSLRETNAKEFEEAHARAMNESGEFTEINRLLSYGKYKSTIHIHAPAGETVEKKFTLYRQGMRDLAQIVKDDAEIKEITAVSPIVAEHQELFSRKGFVIENVSEESKQRIFPGETREVRLAGISREDFLTNFLEEK